MVDVLGKLFAAGMTRPLRPSDSANDEAEKEFGCRSIIGLSKTLQNTIGRMRGKLKKYKKLLGVFEMKITC